MKIRKRPSTETPSHRHWGTYAVGTAIVSFAFLLAACGSGNEALGPNQAVVNSPINSPINTPVISTTTAPTEVVATTNKTWKANDDAGVNVNTHDVATDAKGNATAVWGQSVRGSFQELWTSRLSVGSKTWSTPVKLSNVANQNAYDPRVFIDANGNPVAVWMQQGNSGADYWSSRSLQNGTWETPTQIGTNFTGNAGSPIFETATDSKGNLVTIYVQKVNNSKYDLRATYYTTSGNWGPSTLVATNASGFAMPKLSINDSGRAVIAWNQYDGARSNAWATYFTVGNSWTAPIQISPVNTTNQGTLDLQVALDNSGNATSLWLKQDPNGKYENWSNRFDASSNSWGIAQKIKNDGVNSGPAQIIMDALGATAVWIQVDASDDKPNAWANRYTQATGWGTPVKIENSSLIVASYFDLKLMPDGKTASLWVEEDGAVWINVFDPQINTWGTAQSIGGGAQNTFAAGVKVEPPKLSYGANGNAVATWRSFDRTLGSARFD
jgi:hypothetical protein